MPEKRLTEGNTTAIFRTSECGSPIRKQNGNDCSSADRSNDPSRQTRHKDFKRSAAQAHHKLHARYADVHFIYCEKSFNNEILFQQRMEKIYCSGVKMPNETSRRLVQGSEKKGNPSPECRKSFDKYTHLQINMVYARESPGTQLETPQTRDSAGFQAQSTSFRQPYVLLETTLPGNRTNERFSLVPGVCKCVYFARLRHLHRGIASFNILPCHFLSCPVGQPVFRVCSFDTAFVDKPPFERFGFWGFARNSTWSNRLLETIYTFQHGTPSARRTNDDCSNDGQPEEPSKKTHPGGPHKCLVCGKSFRYLSVATRHNEVHVEEANFQCSLCKKSFRIGRWFQQHMRRFHPGGEAKPLRASSKRVQESQLRGNPCPECGKCFSSWKVLFQHQQLSHGEEGRQQCDECGALFCRKWNLDRHARTVHGKQGRHVCEQCGQTCSRLDILRKHVSTMHKQLTNEKQTD
ncbi:hypothetical protein CSKR_113125 [Clonorchis sinensis]|uniref:C2H2-type domain-containing protein n=1 Tax=Clonorchis sinensis TaxID=79923 RepID=A0A419Q9J1_CLOSI|nr:hypothetical protein CSKR_113125 [Clonorchis sinensis]